ncbi:MAG TPA: isochorismatase family cysteine hydrolase [candidate division Zixibacteria bacterium]|nr:isochorismatase family cysteine hydrolase [candidate division Zixibacteria bacterium]
MRKEDYFTELNKESKIAEWKEILSRYYSKKRNFKFDIINSALLIIDMQEYFLNPKSHAFLPAARTIIEPIKKIQDFFKKNNRPNFFIQYGLDPELDKNNIMNKWWNDSLSIIDPLYKISPEFEVDKENIIVKNTYDAFSGTNLANILAKSGSTSIMITGVATHLCCETTARNAFNLNFEVFLPIDCIATYTEELHLNSLKAASHGFGIPITSNEILGGKNK